MNMNINVNLLDKCPELSDYEKDLIRRVDIDHETQAGVAKSLEKTTSTVSIQHKAALKKFEAWRQRTEREKADLSKDTFERDVFRLFLQNKLPDAVIAEFGRADEVVELWDKYSRIKEDDYYRAQSKLAEYGYSPSADSRYPVSEQLEQALDDLNDWGEWLNEEDAKVRAVLGEQGIKGGAALGGYGSTAEGVQSLAERLHQTQLALNSVNKQKEDLSRRLDETTKKLSDTAKKLEDEQFLVLKLRRLEKYENMSDEKRESLQREVSAAQNLIKSLNQKVVELRVLKTDLEAEVNGLRRQKKDVISLFNHIRVDARNNIKDTVLEVLGGLRLNEVLDLYGEASLRQLQKKGNG
jgi:hypothetical protein